MDGITISSDFPQKLAAIKGGIPAALSAALRAVAREMRKNFLGLDAARHKRGGMHFYKVEGTNRLSTRKLSDTAGEVVVDSKLMKHKYLGGRISAVNVKYLAIPLTDAAYGKEPSKYGGGGKGSPQTCP